MGLRILAHPQALLLHPGDSKAMMLQLWSGHYRDWSGEEGGLVVLASKLVIVFVYRIYYISRMVFT